MLISQRSSSVPLRLSNLEDEDFVVRISLTKALGTLFLFLFLFLGGISFGTMKVKWVFSMAVAGLLAIVQAQGQMPACAVCCSERPPTIPKSQN